MTRSGRVRWTLAASVAATLLSNPGASVQVAAQAAADSPPNPYQVVTNHFKLPEGRTMGSTAAIDIDRDGRSVWVFERCGGASQAQACAESNLAPVLKFDASGKLVKSFGAGMFVSPHGIHVDRQGNIWVADGAAKDGKGHQVFKFSPEGKVLMTLGKAGVAGDGPDTFGPPSDILVAPNGDIFVADGHGGQHERPHREVLERRDVHQVVGQEGIRAGRVRHAALARDGLKADACSSPTAATAGFRFSIRTENSSPSGSSSAGRAGSTSIGTTSLYAADTQSDEKTNPGFKRGIRSREREGRQGDRAHSRRRSRRNRRGRRG